MDVLAKMAEVMRLMQRQDNAIRPGTISSILRDALDVAEDYDAYRNDVGNVPKGF